MERTPSLREGDLAPDFRLARSGGGDVALSELRGKDVIIYFYPKDDTSGCTKEACAFRDSHDDLTAANAVVLGISPDSVQSHDRFTEKYDLPFALLADPDHAVAEAYGVWGEKSMYGKKYMGIDRSTFIVGPDGTIKKAWRNVKPDTHVADVVQVLAPAS